MSSNYQLQLRPLFNAVGVKKDGFVTITKYTHDFDPKAPQNHWLYATFLGFAEYKKRYGTMNSFVSVGSGPGICAIGAFNYLKPKEIYLTDIHPKIPVVAKSNVQANVSEGVSVYSLRGDLCRPLIKRKVKVDLVYANIPNIPSDQPKFENRDSASFYVKRDDKNVPDVFKKYLLTLQYLFLKEAKQVLNKGGAVIDAIGGRLPYNVLKDLFTANGYKFEELVSVFKIQTEPNYVLRGYAQAEKEYGVEFDFYSYDEAHIAWLKIRDRNYLGPKLKEELKKYRVTATQAFAEYKKSGKNFGHIVHILCGKI